MALASGRLLMKEILGCEVAVSEHDPRSTIHDPRTPTTETTPRLGA